MKLLLWALRLLVFFLLFVLAVKNSAPVTLRFFFASEVQVPLSVVILASFAGGMLLGVLVMLGKIVQQRWALGRCRQQHDAAGAAK